MKKILAITLPAILLATTSIAKAEEKNTDFDTKYLPESFYLGIGGKLFSPNFGNNDTLGISYNNILDSNYTAIDGFIGIKINKNFGIELGIEHGLGSKNNNSFAGNTITSDIDINGEYIDLKGYIEVFENTYITPSVGLGQYEIDLGNASITNGIITQILPEDDSTALRAGIGIEHDLADSFFVRTGFNYIGFDSNYTEDMYSYNLGFGYRFDIK